MVRPRHKYKATPITLDGIRFDSKREAKRYGVLMQMQMAGQIRKLTLQPKFTLEGPNGPLIYPSSNRRVTYYADFAYDERNEAGEWVSIIEDVKGMETPLWRLKAAIMAGMGHPIRVTK